MAINVETARTAGELATKIDAITAVVANIQSLIDDNSTLIEVRMTFNLTAGGTTSLNLEGGDQQASLACLNLAKSIYQAQLDAANAQLAAL